MSIYNPSLTLTNFNQYVKLTDDNTGNLVISGSNPNMNINLITGTGSFEVNGSALPTPQDIETLTNEVNQINANLQTAGVDVFSSPPFQIKPFPNVEPPTNKAILVGHNFSGFVVEGTADDKYGSFFMKEDDQLNIDCNDGEGKITLNAANVSTNCTTVDLACSESVVIGQSGNNLTFAPQIDNSFSISTGGQASIKNLVLDNGTDGYLKALGTRLMSINLNNNSNIQLIPSDVDVDPNTNAIVSSNESGLNDLNIRCANLLVNGAPVGGGGSQALEETFATEPVSTFSTQPVVITAVDNQSCEMLLNKGGRLSIMTPDGSGISTLAVDNSNNVNIDCNSLLVNGVTVSNNAITECINVPAPSTFLSPPVIITSITDQKCQMNLAKGSNLNLQSPDTTKNASVYAYDNDSLNISGVAQTNVDSGLAVKSGNQLQINNTANSNVGYIYNTYNEFTVESTGATNLFLKSGGNKIYAEAPLFVRNEFTVKPQSGSGVESKAVWTNDDISKYIEMKYLTNSSDQLDFYNSTNAGFNFQGGNVYDNALRVQQVQSGDTASRPSGVPIGFCYFDTGILPKPHAVWYTGTGSTGWVDASGNDV